MNSTENSIEKFKEILNQTSGQTVPKELQGKIVWLLTGNFFHSDLTRFEEMYNNLTQVFKTFNDYKLQVSISYQGIDLLMMSDESKMELKKASNIQMISSTWSHSLLPLINEKATAFETSNMCGEYSFFSEYLNPLPHFIKTKYFFILRAETHAFSLDYSINPMVSNFPNDCLSVINGDKVGFIMQEVLYKPLLDQFFYYQRFPTQENLNVLIDLFEALGNSKKFVILPLDIEAVFIGSWWGNRIYKNILEALEKRGLKDIFISINKAAESLEKVAVNFKTPKRLMHKWASHFEQLKDWQNRSALPEAKNIEEMMIQQISYISDNWSAKNRKFNGEIIYPAITTDGVVKNIVFSHNPIIEKICDAAYFARKDGQSFLYKLQKMIDKKIINQNDLLAKLVINLAKNYNL